MVTKELGEKIYSSPQLDVREFSPTDVIRTSTVTDIKTQYDTTVDDKTWGGF